MDISDIKKYVDMEFDKYKITQAVTAVKNELKNKEGGRDIVMSDYFKTLREPLVAQQKKKTNEKRDKLIERLEENQTALTKGLQNLAESNRDLVTLQHELSQIDYPQTRRKVKRREGINNYYK